MYITKDAAIEAMKTDPHKFERISILGDRCNVKLRGAENMTFFTTMITKDGRDLCEELIRTLTASKCNVVIYNKREGWRGEMVEGEIKVKTRIKATEQKEIVVNKEDLFAPTETTTILESSYEEGIFTVTTTIISERTWKYGGLDVAVNTTEYPPQVAAYIPGDNGYMENKEAARMALAILGNDQPLLLEGHTGCGKTEMIKWLAYKTNNPLLMIQGSEDMETASLLGHLEIDERGTFWVDGLVTTAVKEGHWLYFDEINSCSAGVKIALHGLLDDNRHIILSDHRGERVKAHPNFRFIAACNPADHGGYLGAGFENVAFLNRFSKLQIEYMDEASENKLLHQLFPAADETNIANMIKAAGMTRAGFAEGKISNVITTRDLKMLFANEKLLGMETALCILGGKFNTEDKKRFYDAISLHLGIMEDLKTFLKIV